MQWISTSGRQREVRPDGGGSEIGVGRGDALAVASQQCRRGPSSSDQRPIEWTQFVRFGAREGDQRMLLRRRREHRVDGRRSAEAAADVVGA